jgi:3-oxoacyl-[acyl-carrier protein] reductase
MNRFTSQIALITGGAQGIGFAIAKRIAAEGAKVWLLDTNENLLNKAIEQITREGGKAMALVANISDELSVTNGFEKIISIDSKIDIMINAAGVIGPNGLKTGDVEYDLFKQTLDVNLNGAFLITRHALNAMLPNKYGRILLISSIAGKEGNAGMAAYSASKAGVIGLVKSAGKEYARSGITINALAPATIMTSMVKAMAPKQVMYMTDKIPMKRCGELNEIASMAAWIVSGEASFNTGFTFDLTGGRAVY